MADDAEHSDTLSIRTERGGSGAKRFWVEEWQDPRQSFSWRIQLERKGDYEVTVMIRAPEATRFTLRSRAGALEFETNSDCDPAHHWYRLTLPTPLTLPSGNSTLDIRLNKPVVAPHGAALKSVELLNVRERPELDRKIAEFRSSARWLAEAKFGMMTQCGEWSFPPNGPRKPWPRMADQFDVEKFSALVDSTGAGYAVWSATWATYYFPAPIHAIDDIMPGRTSERDLIGDIADALAKRNIRLILYYHVGHEVSAQNGSWWARNWMSPSDKSLFFKNWSAIIGEVGQRYGDRLSGWMFDDDLVYYPAPYEQLGEAAKAGSRSRIISYNPWIQPRGTDFQDFQFGEGFKESAQLPKSARGIWPSGPQKGLQAHGNFQVDGPDWGINRADEQITPPFFSTEKAKQFALDAAQHDIALSWNLNMYDDGSVSQQSLEVMQTAGDAVRRVYVRKQDPRV